MTTDETKSGEAADHEFTEIGQGVARPEDTLQVDDLDTVRMDVTADLGSCQMNVRDVLKLHRGSLVALDKLAGEMTELRVNGIKGRGCKDATREIELALGAVTEDKATAEMYQTAGENVHQRQG